MTTRRAVLSAAASLVVWRIAAHAQGPARSPDAAHRILVDVPIVADDPVAVPLAISMDHPMEPDHYVRSLAVSLPGDPVPAKGLFRFTPLAGRASVSYQFRSGQGGELVVAAECTRHGRFAVRHPVRVAPGGCAVPPGPAARERGGDPTVRVDGRARGEDVVAVWASLKHASHTGLVERRGRLVQERPAYFVERLATYRNGEPVNDFSLTAAVSPDPRLRFFVRGAAGMSVRVEFVNNRGERWEANQRLT